MVKRLRFFLSIALFATLSFISQAQTCLEPRLIIGQEGRVLPDMTSIIYAAPDSNSEQVMTVPAGEVMEIAASAYCLEEGLLWAQGVYGGKLGWILEAENDVYLIEPVAEDNGLVVAVPSSSIYDVAWASNDHLYLATSMGLYRYDMTNPDAELVLIDANSTIRWIAVNPQNPAMLVTVAQAADASTSLEVRLEETVIFQLDSPEALAIIGFKGDGSRLMLQTLGEFRLYDTNDWSIVWSAQRAVYFNNAAYSANGQWLVYADLNANETVRLLNLETEAVRPLPMGTKYMRLAISHDGRFILGTTNNFETKVYDAQSGTTTVVENSSNQTFISPLRYSPVDNSSLRLFASSTLFYQMENGTTVYWHPPTYYNVTNFIFSPDGTQALAIIGNAIYVRPFAEFDSSLG